MIDIQNHLRGKPPLDLFDGKSVAPAKPKPGRKTPVPPLSRAPTLKTKSHVDVLKAWCVIKGEIFIEP